MTLTVKIKNDGNQPGDILQLRGMKQSGDGHVQFTGDPDDSVILGHGEEISCWPPLDHFSDPASVSMKGKH